MVLLQDDKGWGVFHSPDAWATKNFLSQKHEQFKLKKAI